MSTQPTHQRKLAKASGTKTSMDPTNKKHPKASPFTSTTTKPHPTPPDPTHNISSSTVQNISNHFSRLYSNHKDTASLKPSTGHPHPQPLPFKDTHLQAKAMSISTISDVPISSLIKSSTNTKYRRTSSTDLHKGSIKKSVEEILDTKRAVVSDHKTDEIKKMSKKEREIKKPTTTNQETEVVKGIHEEMRNRPSVSVVAMNGIGGRRKSFCSSQTELTDFLSCNGVKIVSVDMPPFMQIHAVDFTRKTYDSLEKFTARTLASSLKKEFDGVYGPAWHCIVGTSFGSFVTHSVGGFLYFSMDHKLYILLFKTTVQKAD